MEVEPWTDNSLHSALVGSNPSVYGVLIALVIEISNNRPRSVPALELLSRALSSVGVYYTVPMVPTQGAIPEEGG